jgi:hypothetical protein
MIVNEAEPELKRYVHVTAVLPINVVILTRFSKRLRQFIAKYRTSTASLIPIIGVKENRTFH